MDVLDQNSVEAAQAAQAAEDQRVRELPDHQFAIDHYPHIIQELNTDDAPLEDKAVDFLRNQAIEIAIKLQMKPDEVSEESINFAARFYGTSDASRESIIAAFDRYHDFAMTLGWAVTYNQTIAEALKNIAATRPLLRPDPNLIEKKPDPFRSLWDIDFRVEGDDDWDR